MNVPLLDTDNRTGSNYQSYLNKQRNDKFIMVFSLPEALKPLKNTITRKNNTILPDTIQFSIFGAVIPDIKVPEVEIPYGGQVMKVSSLTRPSYPNNTIDFTVDNHFNNYWVIYKWLQLFNNEKTSNTKDISTLKEYQTTVTIYGLDEYNNRVIQFDFLHTFPVALGGIKYSDRDSAEMTSNFEYTYHQLEATLL